LADSPHPDTTPTTPPFEFGGSGSGAHTQDGCAVELYRQLPYLGDLDPVRELLPCAASVLELGCGTGRLTRVLLEWGLQITAVDHAPEMLAHLPQNTEAILSRIDALYLAQRFDRVLLASNIINYPQRAAREAMIAAAARHLKPGGMFLLQRFSPVWLETAQVGSVVKNEVIEIALDQINRYSNGVAIALTYRIAGQQWQHRFHAESLDEMQLEQLLQRHGLHNFAWHGPERLWLSATLGEAQPKP
jgi:SAM-dependent methyltransferase